LLSSRARHREATSQNPKQAQQNACDFHAEAGDRLKPLYCYEHNQVIALTEPYHDSDSTSFETWDDTGRFLMKSFQAANHILTHRIKIHMKTNNQNL
jgi:hypothetical protein